MNDWPVSAENDVRLTIALPDGTPLLSDTLQFFGLRGRNGHEVLTFLYRDPEDPDNPDEDRPLRRARLVVEELGTL